MTKSSFETQYSIYKVDYDESVKYFNEKEIKIESYKDLEEKIIEDIKKKVKKNIKNEIYEIKDNNFKGVVFKSYHIPTWEGIISCLIGEKIELDNIHVSYILTYLKGKNLFLLTAGLGSSYIGDFIIKNYGLYLLPKITKEGNKTVKGVYESRILGNRVSSRRANRNATAINTENDMGSIIRELSLEIEQEIIELLAIDNPRNIKKLNILARDSFIVRKSLTKENIIKILNNLINIERKDDNFSLGYFIEAKKRGYSSQQLNELLYECLISKDLKNFQLIGSDYAGYCVAATKYVISDGDGNIIYEKKEQITMEDLYEHCMTNNINKSSAELLLKNYISVYRENDEVILPPTKLKNCMQANIENNDGKNFFLFNGNWLMFDDTYTKNLDNEYRKKYKEITDIDKEFISIVLNKNHKCTEEAYNNTFEGSQKVILAHKVKINNIELADLIYYDEDNLYLVHNKMTFDGPGSRDLYGQILSSCELLRYIDIEKDKKEILEKYYNSILEKYPKNMKMKSITFEEFIKLFNKANIYYVAGFMQRVTENKRSNYAKYLTIDTAKKLEDKGFKLLLFDINSK